MMPQHRKFFNNKKRSTHTQNEITRNIHSTYVNYYPFFAKSTFPIYTYVDYVHGSIVWDGISFWYIYDNQMLFLFELDLGK